MEKVRVLHLMKTIDLGGTESNLANLVSATPPGRSEVHIGYAFGGVNEERYRDTGARLFKYDEKSRKIADLGMPAAVFRIARYVLRHRIQVIHTHNFNAHVLGTLAARFTGARLVEHVHDYRYLEEDDYKMRHGDIVQYRYIRYLPPADRVIVLTMQNKDYLLRHRRYPETRIREIKNGIRIHPPARPNGASPAEKIILTTARLAPEKNIELLFTIAEKVHARVPEAVFIVTGTGPLEDHFRRLCREKGMEPYLKFIGFYAGDVRDLMKKADIYLLPSLLELHSIAVLEAMSHPLPVVISRGVGSNDEFIKNWENGVLCDPFSGEGWDDAIVRLLEDEGLRRRLAENAYRTCVDQFDIRDTARRIEDVHLELAESAR